MSGLRRLGPAVLAPVLAVVVAIVISALVMAALQVMLRGRLVARLDPKDLTPEELGGHMTGAHTTAGAA